MALGDIPKIPSEYKPRIKKLFQKIKTNEITADEVQNNILTVLGKVTIDSKGITISGDYGTFEIDSSGLSAGMQGVINIFDLISMFIGKKYLTKRGDEFTLVKIGLGLKKSRATEKDIKNPRLPIVEFNTEVETGENNENPLMRALSFYLEDPISTQKKSPGKFKIHRLEEFAGWFGEGWSNVTKAYRINLSLMELMTKGRLDKLGESMGTFCDHVLKKCGV